MDRYGLGFRIGCKTRGGRCGMDRCHRETMALSCENDPSNAMVGGACIA